MAWWKRFASGRGVVSSQDRGPAELMEPLENRTLLSFDHTFLSNMPSLAQLESPLNTVVRFQTNYGIFDIEMYDQVAPGTVENFLQYVRDGAYDRTFFHRLVSDFVLQGGGFKFDDDSGLSSVTTRPPIQNEFQRSNLEMTVAMAKVGGDPNSATSQFFFNLKDNPDLNSQNGGFTVFGKVVNGWAAVEGIAGLSTRDLDVPLTGFGGSVFDNVPVGGNYIPQIGPQEQSLVMIWDAEIIKPAGVAAFMTQGVYFPEGFRSANVVERVDLVNVDTGTANHFQILVRYESGERDQIVATGVLQPGARRTIKIVDANLANFDLVRSGVGFAFEIRSTRTLAASLNHRDFGVTLGESFMVADNLTEGGLKNWNFASGEKGPGHRTFLVWQNLSDQEITVNVAIHPQSEAPRVFSVQLDRYRRGGLAVHLIGSLPDKAFSVRISATGPIIAAMSRYEDQGSGFNATHNGTSQGGVVLGGRVEGYLAAARIPTGGTSTLSVMYSAASPAVVIVDFDFLLLDGTRLVGTPVLLTNAVRRKDIDLSTMNPNLPANQFFSIRYTVRANAAPVTVDYTTQHAGDTLSTSFMVASNGVHYFGDGFIDPALAGTSYAEIISVFNPYTDSRVTFSFGLKFLFSDGSVVNVPGSTLAPLGRADIRPQLLPSVMSKVNSGPQFRFYSVVVGTTQLVNGNRFDGAGVSQLTRIHSQASWRQTLTTLPMIDPNKAVIYMDAPQFDPL